MAPRVGAEMEKERRLEQLLKSYRIDTKKHYLKNKPTKSSLGHQNDSIQNINLPYICLGSNSSEDEQGSLSAA